jgi:ribosomal protein L29
MSIFRKKTKEELEKELADLKAKRATSAEIRQLKKAILTERFGKATDLFREGYHGVRAVGREVGKAYSPEAQERARRMKRYLGV